MDRIPVQSSYIASVGYEAETEAETGRLEVEFINPKGNRVFSYDGVPEWVYRDLIDPEFPGSKGQYFNRVVKGGGFNWQEVKQETQ